MLWFFWPRDTTPDIVHRLANRISRCAMMHVVILWPRDTKDIAHRLANRISRCAMMHVVIFWPRDTKDIAHRLANRIGRCCRNEYCLKMEWVAYGWHRPTDRIVKNSLFVRLFQPPEVSMAVVCNSSPFLLDNLHFEHCDENANHRCMLKYSSKCSKWRLSQPSATHPRFWQTCLFTIFPKMWTNNLGWNILCCPNEDLGKRNSRSGVSFRVNLRAFVA